MLPTKVCFVTGQGWHRLERVAIQYAMELAGTGHLNLVKVSSVLPANCEIVDKSELSKIEPGTVTFAVIGQAETNKKGDTATVCLGVIIPDEKDIPGWIAEVEEGINIDREKAVIEVEQMAMRIFGMQTGEKHFEPLPPGQDKYIIVGKSVTSKVFQSHVECLNEGEFAVALVAAIFLPDA
jgi:pyruvoyl-dependent arginine decarboxylase